MNDCCTRNLGGNFCPECGTRLRGEDMASLLRHISKVAAVESNRVSRMEEMVLKEQGKSYGDLPAKSKLRIDKRRASATKWKAWADGLQTLLSAGETS